MCSGNATATVCAVGRMAASGSPLATASRIIDVEIAQLLRSPLHRYAGRPSDGPVGEPADELVDRIEIREGLGIVGDRYFGQRAHRNAAITLMAAESLTTGILVGADLRQTRRNVLLSGIDIDAWVGRTIRLDSGSGPVLLQVNRPARPCEWMDATIGPGACKAMRATGGVRCTPLSDGRLTLGAATLSLRSDGLEP